METAIVVQVAEGGADAERLDALTTQLRDELLHLNVDDVRPAVVGEAPPGSRAIELAAIGALIVTLQQSEQLVAGVVNLVRQFIKRDAGPALTVHLTIGGKSIELSNATADQQQQLVQEFLRSVAAASSSSSQDVAAGPVPPATGGATVG